VVDNGGEMTRDEAIAACPVWQPEGIEGRTGFPGSGRLFHLLETAGYVNDLQTTSIQAINSDENPIPSTTTPRCRRSR